MKRAYLTIIAIVICFVCNAETLSLKVVGVSDHETAFFQECLPVRFFQSGLFVGRAVKTPCLTIDVVFVHHKRFLMALKA
jgi:hypothetical protein